MENEKREHDIHEYLKVLRGYRAFICLFVFVAILFSAALSYIVSEKYVAAATIFYRPREMSLLRVKEAESFGGPVPSAPFKVIQQTLSDAVQNEVVLRPVVEELGLDKEVKQEYSNPYSRWYHETKTYIKDRLSDAWMLLKYGRVIEEDPVVAAIKGLRKNIKITATKESYIYVLQVKDKYPERAAMIVDLAGAHLVEWLQNEYQNPAQKRLIQLKEQLEQKQNDLLSYREQRASILSGNKFVSISEETRCGVENLYDMKLEYARLNADIEKEKRKMLEYEELLSKSNSRLQPEDYRELKTEKVMGEADLQGLIEKQGFLKASINELKAQLDAIPVLQKKIDNLNMQIETSTYDLKNLKDMYTETFTKAKADQAEAKALHHAVVPSMPIQPIKIYHVGLSVVLSLLLAVGVAFVSDYLNIEMFSSASSGQSAKTERYIAKETLSNFSAAESSAFLKAFASKMDSRGGSMFWVKEDKLQLASSLDEGHVPVSIPLPLKHDSVFGQVIKHRKPMVIENISARNDIKSSGWNGYEDKSLLTLPISNKKGVPVGVVSLHNRKSSSFTEKDIPRSVSFLNSYLRGSQEASLGDSVNFKATQSENFSQSKVKRSFFGKLFVFIVTVLCGAILAAASFYLLTRIGF